MLSQLVYDKPSNAGCDSVVEDQLIFLVNAILVKS